MSGCGENKSNKGAGNRGKNRVSNLTKDSNKDNKSSDTDIDSNDNDTDNSDKDTGNNGTNKKGTDNMDSKTDTEPVNIEQELLKQRGIDLISQIILHLQGERESLIPILFLEVQHSISIQILITI